MDLDPPDPIHVRAWIRFMALSSNRLKGMLLLYGRLRHGAVDVNSPLTVGADVELTQARFWLVSAVKTILAHGLGVLGVEAPETM